MRLPTQSAMMMKMLAMTISLHFLWDSQCLAQVWFAELSGNNWSYTEIDPLKGSGNSLVFDASGNPHITYAVYDQTLSSSILKYATRTSGTWTTRTLESLGSPPAQYQPPIPTSLAINPVTMRPNVFYLTQANATPTSYRYGEVTPDGFVSEPVDSAGSWYASEGTYASLAIDSTGKPHVAYWKEPRSDLLYAVRNDGAWSSSTVATGRVYFSSLALNSDQTPGIAFYQETVAGSQGDLVFASPTNSGWQSEYVDGNTSGRYFGYQPSLAFASDNLPRIAYTDIHGGLIKYAVQTGTSWEKESIASTAQGNTQAFSSLIVTATSVMNLFTDNYLDPDGVTTVFDQYLSTRTEAGWRSEFLTPSSRGAWNSLALNASNKPAFVFSSAVPEPSTCFSLAAGLAFGCWRLRCRRTSDA